MSQPPKSSDLNLTSNRREVAAMPDTDICSVVTPSEATQIPQAVNLKHFKPLGVFFKVLSYGLIRKVLLAYLPSY